MGHTWELKFFCWQEKKKGESAIIKFKVLIELELHMCVALRKPIPCFSSKQSYIFKSKYYTLHITVAVIVQLVVWLTIAQVDRVWFPKENWISFFSTTTHMTVLTYFSIKWLYPGIKLIREWIYHCMMLHYRDKFTSLWLHIHATGFFFLCSSISYCA